MYGPEPAPTRITIDFSGSLHPARAWIIGRVDESGGRVELLAFERSAPTTAIPADRKPASPAQAPAQATAIEASAATDCTCPEFCERDHANE